MDFPYISKSQCSGCSLCKSVCHSGAIQMLEDNYGFIYPVINQEKCTDCGICRHICPMASVSSCSEGSEYFLSFCHEEKILNKSASGGVFAILAKRFIESGGVVVGSCYNPENSKLYISHKAIEDSEDICYLQGSKYVQSSIENVLPEIESYLNCGRRVLFSGTPCQVAAVKKIAPRNWKHNLFTIDLICHGVPSEKLFNDYLDAHFSLHKNSIVNFSFRDKSRYGWGLNAKVEYYDSVGTSHSKFLSCNQSSYYYLFLHGYTYRDSCYHCLYATRARVGDITIGDYWGVEDEFSHEIDEGIIAPSKGVSCVFTNTENGRKALDDVPSSDLYIVSSSFDAISKRNGQLVAPMTCPDERLVLFSRYPIDGYSVFDLFFKQHKGMNYYSDYIKSKIPYRITRNLKSLCSILKIKSIGA